MDQFLGGGFAIAAGDGDEWDIELAAMMQGELLQGSEDVGDEDETVGPAGSRVLVDDGIGGALLQGFGGKGIAIEVGPFEGEEKVAVLQLPRIRPDRWVSQINVIKLFDRHSRKNTGAGQQKYSRG
jgi:hypothetical protein